MALFGIKRIQYCKATQLAFSGQNNPFLGIASEPTNTFTDIVCMINSRATLTIEQAVVNKQIVYTAKLQFVTPADPMLDVDHYAFIATTNEGERILLGANTRPQVAVVTAQGVFGNAGELTAYTTTAEFKADYRPLRLPVTAAEPISGPAYDICCGQIPQPTAPDTREFDICCGQIKTSEPISGPAYDVCCGEIQGEAPVPPVPTIVFINITATEAAPWIAETYMPNYSASELIDQSYTNQGTTARLPIAINSSERYYEVLSLYPRRAGTLLTMDISAMQEYSNYQLIKDPIDNAIPIGYTNSQFPSNKIAVAYAYEADNDQFFTVGLIYSKNTQIQDISDPNNPTGYIITREGHRCIGWAYRAGGDAVTLGVATRHIILYALWEAI